MAFVSSSTGNRSGSSFTVSSTVASGDVLIAFIYTQGARASSGAATVDRWSAPAGWVSVGAWDATPYFATTITLGVSVLWKRVTSAGTETATFTWPGSVFDGTVVVTRWSGMESVAGASAQRASGRAYSYPSVTPEQVALTGHAIRVAITDYLPITSWTNVLNPAGHTERVNLGAYKRWHQNGVERWASLVVSEQALSATAPAPVSRSTGTTTVAGWAVTLYLASTFGPPAPNVTSPAATESVKDLGAAWTLAWTPNGVQTGVRVTRQSLTSQGVPTGSVQYLTNVATPAWSTTPTTVTTATTAVNFGAGAWDAAGARYRITVATVGDANRPSLGTATTRDVESWQAPTATNARTAVAHMTGSQINTRAPWLFADGTPGSGASLDLYEVYAVDSTTGQAYAGGTYHPGWWYPVPATPEGALPNGAVVRLRGRVRQRGTQWSEWVEAGPFTVDVPRPAAPTVSVALIEHPVSGLPGLAVTVSSVAGRVTLYRDGVLLDSWDSTGSLTISDYTPPTDVPVSYTASVSVGSPLPEESLPSVAAATLKVSSREWLIDPLDPSTAVSVILSEVGDVTHGTRSTPYQPINSSRHIVGSLGRVDMTGSMTLQTLTREATVAALALLTSTRRLILRVRPDRGVIDRELHPNGLPEMWRVVSDVSEDRPAQRYAWRALSFDWVEQR